LTSEKASGILKVQSGSGKQKGDGSLVRARIKNIKLI